MSLARGLFRVWAIAAPVWVIYAADRWHAAYEIDYAHRYATNKAALTEEQRAFCLALHPPATPEPPPPIIDSNSEYEVELRRLSAKVGFDMSPPRAVPPVRAQVPAPDAHCYRDADPPSYDWLAWIVLPPTLGVILVLAALFAVVRSLRWVVSGFASKP